MVIGWFITSHGFGHAARSSAVMAAIHRINPRVKFEIFTRTPTWFFKHSIKGPFTCHSLLTDVGMAQKSPLHEDLEETQKMLDGFLPFDPVKIKDMAALIKNLGCHHIVADIAPMGIVVAREAGVPSVLLENFTWDWIYESYTRISPGMERHIDYLGGIFKSADYRIQTEPVCSYSDKADLVTPPVSRRVKLSKNNVRESLGIPSDSGVVMISMGGIRDNYMFLERLKGISDVYFIIPGGSREKKMEKNLILLPFNSNFFHPDLIFAANCVVGKVGYSTLAEVYNAGTPFGYIPRPHFRESGPLTEFIEREMAGIPIYEKEYRKGGWVDKICDLLKIPAIPREQPKGDDMAGRFILDAP